MTRTRAWRRHQRDRVVANRRRFIRAYWQPVGFSATSREHFLSRPDGRYAKRKVLECSCWMCQYPSGRPVESWNANLAACLAAD